MTFEWLAAILATCHGTVLDAYDVRRASGGRWWVAPTGSIGSVPTFEIDDKQCNERHHRSVKVGVLELDEALDHTMRCVNEQLANKSRAGRRLDLRNPVIHVRGGQVTVELVEIEPGPAPDPVEFRFAASPGPCSLIDPHARR